MARTPEVRRRTKRLLRSLSNLQDDDCTITPQTLLAAKYLLRVNSKCYCVNVTNADMLDHLALWCPRSELPNFIVSQLEAQQLTNPDSDLVLVPPQVSVIILSAYPPEPEGKDWPTLFRWYSKERHRYYCLFAYVRFKMGRKSYTIAELLAFRGKQPGAPSGMSALAENPELGKFRCLSLGSMSLLLTGDSVEIVRESSSDSSSGCKVGTLSKNKDRSSTSSDEILFKGTLSRRGLPRDASRDQPNREPVRVPVRELHRESIRDQIQEVGRVATRETIRESIRDIGRGEYVMQDASRSMEWKYRGRSDSETPVVEPIQAPGGVSAQKSEGFQRFYKAVVSPTHVRVTAGGRIVPNTRGPPSPTVKRTTDTPALESQGLADKTLHTKTPMNQPGVGQPIPMMPQFLPGYPPGFQPIQTPVSFMPLALGPHMPPGFSFPQASANPVQGIPSFPADGTLKDMHNTKPGDVQIEGRVPDDKQDKLKISPPEFFDYTKPYYYNGQIIYPVGAFQPPMGNGLGAPMANTMMPIPMISSPMGVAHQIPAQMMRPQPGGMSTNTMAMPPFGHQSQHGGPVIPTNVAPAIPANTNFNAPTAPPPSSIKLSDITRKQIASFKSALRYHEDQMQYNRHQIDEKEMEQKIHSCKEHIARFEATLKSQIEYEETLQRQHAMDQAKGEMKPSHAGASAQLVPYAGQTATATQAESDEAFKRRFVQGCQGINGNMSESNKAVFRGAADPTRRSFEELFKKSSLSTEAALAPVFEPRRDPSPPKEQQDAEQQLRAAATWNIVDAVTAEQESLSRSFTMPYAQPSSYIDSRTSTMANFGRPARSRISSQITTSGNNRASYGVPYLLGTLPKGCNPRDATDYDYVYHRPLNDDEQRARFLYWGKAPKSATRGLPKFDGKHFYPASPIKEGSPDSSETDIVARRVPNARPEAENEFRQTKSDSDPFRPLTPVYSSDSKALTLHASEDGYAMVRHTRNSSFDTQVLTAEDLIGDESGGDKNTTSAGHKYENSADAASVGSFERRPERPGYAPTPKPDPRLNLAFRAVPRTNWLTQREVAPQERAAQEGADQQCSILDYGAGFAPPLRRPRNRLFESLFESFDK